MKRRWLRPLGLVLVVLGAWIALFPFSRPLPGGDVTDLARTPEVSCGSPAAASFRGEDDRLLLPREPVTAVDLAERGWSVIVPDPEGYCRGRARFRLATGIVLVAGGVVAAAAAGRGRERSEALAAGRET